MKTEARLELENSKGGMYATLDTERSVVRLCLPNGFVELNLHEALKLSDLILRVLK